MRSALIDLFIDAHKQDMIVVDFGTAAPAAFLDDIRAQNQKNAEAANAATGARL